MFLSNLSRDIIKWPTEAEKQQSEEHFRNNGFPSIIGAIDGTHIKIDKPQTDPDSYINRKGYYSIQVSHNDKSKQFITKDVILDAGSV